MPRTIILLLDGTSNEIKADRSNILRLYGTLKKSADQLVYYDPGVGTFGGNHPLFPRLNDAKELIGMATGRGLDDNVLEAYRFLVETCKETKSGISDRICIFGFSRGAYTARVLAAFLHAFGLMQPRNLNLLDYAYRAFKQVSECADRDSRAEVELHWNVVRPMRPKIAFLGLFDTVSSVIEWGKYRPRLRVHAYTGVAPNVEIVRQAVAIDERRRMFLPQLWRFADHCVPEEAEFAALEGQDVGEVWFPGVHGDIGGGYPEAEGGLAKLPLKWMIDEAAAAGIAFDDEVVEELVMRDLPDRSRVGPDPLAEAHDSMTWAWSLLEYSPRRLRRGGGPRWIFAPKARRIIPEGAVLHWSVTKRPLPPNLPEVYTVLPEPDGAA